MTSNCFGARFLLSRRVPLRKSEKIFVENNSPLVSISVFNLEVFASYSRHPPRAAHFYTHICIYLYNSLANVFYCATNQAKSCICICRSSRSDSNISKMNISKFLKQSLACFGTFFSSSICCKFLAIITIAQCIISSTILYLNTL